MGNRKPLRRAKRHPGRLDLLTFSTRSTFASRNINCFSSGPADRKYNRGVPSSILATIRYTVTTYSSLSLRYAFQWVLCVDLCLHDTSFPSCIYARVHDVNVAPYREIRS